MYFLMLKLCHSKIYYSLYSDYDTDPFFKCPRHWSAAPARRLWSYLVRQEPVQELFIRCVFGKRRSAPSITELVESVRERDRPDAAGHNLPEPVRIIHKEQDSITAFCLNNVSTGLLALATPREVQEMDISLLLEMPSWLEDECELDLMSLNKEPELLPTSGFLVIQTPTDKPVVQNPANNPGGATSPQGGLAGQTGRGASVMKGLNFPGSHDPAFCQLVIDRSRHLLRPVLKHRVDNIRRVSAHPLLPLYLTRLARRFGADVGVGARSSSDSGAPQWHIRQGHSCALQPARQQVRCRRR
ncbi:dmX-like protein 1 isoform X1 [Homalodisca vitripennis]|uniref:dmX-like protein 1 isoform X1 n=1 Tax=Homalodisca vitripennis TaxID=197043 RepID=UPI001EEC0FA0|nr:dmX-like protein 1 isoform X1 [Homalodisca vitripennis]